MMRRSVLPETSDVAQIGERVAEREHRRVRRDDDDLLAGGRPRDDALERGRPSIDDVEARGVHTRVLEAQREVARAYSRDDGVIDARRERFEVRVPDPRAVADVGVTN